MNRNEVIILGAGGHSKGVVETIIAQSIYRLRGFTSPPTDAEIVEILGHPILGDDSLISELKSSGVCSFIVGMGAVGNNAPRRKLYEFGIESGLEPVSAIHPAAIVSESARISAGTVIFSGAIVGADCVIGRNVIVNHGAIVEHDCRVDDHAHIATGACLSGTVHVEHSAHIGAGATILQDVIIGQNAVVAAGAVVVRNVKAGSTVRGVPAS